ncbi:uncharacterized protein DNG_09976 [Cephalotrichum gorgonifer]|uniref:Fe2OG dioxygenase domain-containing protein n=1 Tax=Cephalotrichum gorgonifer TaxID=2041049 RepID=A0AAE8N6V8_9PEZI|nr:uncharacterized protein DNG_09976 [Cephalotrichum gorgonifer]
MTASSKRKRAATKAQASSKVPKITAATITPPPDGAFQPKSLQTVVSEEELEIAVETLTSLAQYPGLIKTKACKDLRAAVHEFRQACTTGVNSVGGTNLTARITGAIADEKYLDAMILLAEMRIRGEEPKLGALCRWVRDLDVISGLSTIPGDADDALIERSEEAKARINVIDAILRVTGPVDSNPDARPASSSPIVLQKAWDLRPSTPSQQVRASVLDKSVFATAPLDLSTQIRAIETTPGLLRKPPNHHDAIVYTTSPGAIPLSASHPPITYHSHPTVPALSLAMNLLSPDECKAIVAAGECVNFIPDAPLREGEDISILAHNFYWVVDQAFHDALWARLAPSVPSSLDGRLARGLNRRFRVYRYVPGAEYRAHIDGAWPPSAILEGDKYVYDGSPADRKQSSLFTLLIYLNDEFEGGETTFFVPAVRERTLNAYPVRPVMGAAAVFPHGDVRGALLHEGTGVRKGAKYVIRTDIEYDIEPTEGL